MVNTRSGKSTNANIPDPENENRISSEVESQHGTHRGAEGEMDDHTPGSEDSFMAGENVNGKDQDPPVNEDDYMSQSESEVEELLEVKLTQGALTPRIKNQGKQFVGKDPGDPSMKAIQETISGMQNQFFNFASSVQNQIRDLTGLISAMKATGKAEEDPKGLNRDQLAGRESNQNIQTDDKSPKLKNETITVTDLMFMNAALAGIKLPKLDNKLHLENHFDTVNDMLKEMNLIIKNGEPHPDYVHRLLALIRESLVDVSEVSQAFDHLKKFGHNWKEIQQSLLNQFCSKASIRRDLETKLEHLRFVKPYPKFIQNIKEIYYVHRRFYSDSGELRSLVRKIIKVMPAFLARPIVKQMMLINEDWALAKPFDQFISMLESHLHIAEECDGATTQSRTRTSEGTKGRDDKLGAIFEKKKPWLEDWVKSFDGVLYCCGPGHRDELQQIEIHSGRLETKLFDKGTKGPYALIGYKGSPPTLNCTTRPFVLKSKN